MLVDSKTDVGNDWEFEMMDRNAPKFSAIEKQMPIKVPMASHPKVPKERRADLYPLRQREIAKAVEVPQINRLGRFGNTRGVFIFQ